MTITLANGRTPVTYEVGLGGDGDRKYLGKVVAYRGSSYIDPWVVWHMASDDGIVWDCFDGSYVETAQRARELYDHRYGMRYAVPEDCTPVH